MQNRNPLYYSTDQNGRSIPTFANGLGGTITKKTRPKTELLIWVTLWAIALIFLTLSLKRASTIAVHSFSPTDTTPKTWQNGGKP